MTRGCFQKNKKSQFGGGLENGAKRLAVTLSLRTGKMPTQIIG
jgi:hypothetical protein